MGIKSKKTPYEGLWVFIPMMILPSVIVTWITYVAIARWQPQFGEELNFTTAKIIGCGAGILFHASCWLMGVFKDDYIAMKTRLKEFCANIIISARIAFSCYWDDIKTLGLAFWIDVAIIGLNAGVFVDAILDYIALR